MSYDTNTLQRIELGKRTALSMGYSPEQVDSYIKTKFGAGNSAFQTSGQRPKGLLGGIVHEAKKMLGVPQLVAGALYEVPRAMKARKGDYSGYVSAEGKTRENPFLRQDELEAFDTSGGKGIGKAAELVAKKTAGTYSALPILMTGGAATIPRLAAAGAISGGLSEAAEKDTSGDKILSAGLMGGVTAGALGIGGRLLSKAKIRGIGKAGQITKTATREPSKAAVAVFDNQFTVPTKIAKQLNRRGVSKQMVKYGISGSFDDMVAKADRVTGDKGVLSDVVRKSVGQVQGEVPVGDALKITRKVLDNKALLNKEVKDNVMTVVGNTVKQGKKPLHSNPLDLLDAIRELEKIGHQELKKSTYLTPNAAAEDIAEAYLTAADELKVALESAVKGQKILPNFKTPQVYNALKEVSPELAEDFWKTQTISDVRKLQSPFVRLKQMIDHTQWSKQSTFNKASRRFGGIPVVSDLVGLADDTVGQQARAGAAKIMDKGAQGAADLVPTGTKQKIAQGIGRAGELVNKAEKLPVNPYVATSRVLNNRGGATPEAGMSPELTSFSQPMESQGVMMDGKLVTPDVIKRAMIKDIATTGGKSISKLETILKLMEPSGGGKGGGVGKASAKDVATSRSGLSSLQQLQTIMANDGGKVLKSKVPFALGARDYQAAAKNVMDAISRLRTGAAMTKNEEAFYEGFLPSPLDPPEVQQQKLQQLQSYFESFAYAEAVGGIGTADQITGY